jgi:hypothetical protein
LLIADAAVNSLSKADERPSNADAKSGEPQDGKQEKDVVLAHGDAAVFGDRLTPCGPSPLQHLQRHGIVLPRQRVVSSRQGATGRAAQPHRRSLVSLQFSLTPVMIFAVGKPSPCFTCCLSVRPPQVAEAFSNAFCLFAQTFELLALQLRCRPGPDATVSRLCRPSRNIETAGRREANFEASSNGYDFMLNDADSVRQRSICSWNDLGFHQL